MSARPVSGKLYIGSITSATGTTGTLISDVQGREYPLGLPKETYLFRTGLNPDQITGYHSEARTPAFFVFRNRDMPDTDGTLTSLATMLQDQWTTAGSSAGVEPGVTNGLAAAATCALIVRPNSSKQRTLYIPNALRASVIDFQIQYGIQVPAVNDTDTILIPTRAAGNTEPAYAWNTAARVNSLYAGLS